jgi:hypothetical protein
MPLPTGARHLTQKEEDVEAPAIVPGTQQNEAQRN